MRDWYILAEDLAEDERIAAREAYERADERERLELESSLPDYERERYGTVVRVETRTSGAPIDVAIVRFDEDDGGGGSVVRMSRILSGPVKSGERVWHCRGQWTGVRP